MRLLRAYAFQARKRSQRSMTSSTASIVVPVPPVKDLHVLHRFSFLRPGAHVHLVNTGSSSSSTCFFARVTSRVSRLLPRGWTPNFSWEANYQTERRFPFPPVSDLAFILVPDRVSAAQWGCHPQADALDSKCFSIDGHIQLTGDLHPAALCVRGCAPPAQAGSPVDQVF